MVNISPGQKRSQESSHLDDLKSVAKGEYGKGNNAFPSLDAATNDPPALFNMKIARNQGMEMNDTNL